MSGLTAQAPGGAGNKNADDTGGAGGKSAKTGKAEKTGRPGKINKNGMPAKKPFLVRLKRDLILNRYLYLLALPVLAFYIIFRYAPMYGIIIAFKNFNPRLGIIGSKWIGFKNFTDFFSGVYFLRVVGNTLMINLLGLLFGFPVPLLLALMINEVRHLQFKKLVQTITYMPHFISIVVVAGIIITFTAKNGIINDIIVAFGGERTVLMRRPELFRPIYITSGIWQEAGFNSIIYIAAIAGVDPELYDAATMDGAGRFRKIWNIIIPSIAPTIVILLILRIGSMMSVGFEKIILLYNESTYQTADVISSYVYRIGLQQFNFSFSAAVGLFNSVINFILVIGANTFSRKIQQSSLW